MFTLIAIICSLLFIFIFTYNNTKLLLYLLVISYAYCLPFFNVYFLSSTTDFKSYDMVALLLMFNVFLRSKIHNEKIKFPKTIQKFPKCYKNFRKKPFFFLDMLVFFKIYNKTGFLPLKYHKS